jgi:uncharacterized repeat protein (TIGR02543 family)
MKRLTIFIIALFSAAAFAQDLPKIAVYVTGDVPDNEKKALGTRMLASLVNSGRYKGIERSNAFLAEVEKEQVKQRSGAIDDGQISELGRQFGVKFVCISDITPAFGEFQVSARIVNVETAEVDFIRESASPLKSMTDLARVSDRVVRNMFGEEAKSAAKAKAEPEPAAPKPEAPTTYTVTAAAKPSNGGAVSASPQKTAYSEGEQVTLTATPYSGFAFANWSGAASSAKNPVTVTMNGNLTLTANFQPTYTITAYAQPADGGAVSVSPKKTAYTAGERVTLTAKPYKGYTFANWSGAAASENSSIVITIDNNVTLTANFQAKPEPEARPKPEPRPKPEFKISAGGGAFLVSGIGGGLTWGNSKENLAMPYTAGGAYIFLDAVYAEAFIGFLAGGGKWQSGDATYQNDLPDMPRASVNIGAFAKYPIAAGTVKMFPLLGLEYEASVSGKLVYASGKEETFDGADGRPDAGVLSALWFRFGCGADFDLSQNLYLRAEFLYGLRTANAYEKSRAEEEAGFGGNTRAGHGFTLKAGAGVRF